MLSKNQEAMLLKLESQQIIDNGWTTTWGDGTNAHGSTVAALRLRSLIKSGRRKNSWTIDKKAVRAFRKNGG